MLGKKAHSKIFCISIQRTGTTSVGHFFRDFNFRWRGWKHCKRNKWAESWYAGDIESIFSSRDFKTGIAFEDSPWWYPDFYKILFHRFPHAKFIHMHRDPDAWFESMLSHSGGKTPGNTKRHSKIYRREREFYGFLDSLPSFCPLEHGSDNLMQLEGNADHYKWLYELHNREVMEFFTKNSPKNYFCCGLEDSNKWTSLGEFLGIDVPTSYEAFKNVSLNKYSRTKA